MKWWYIIVEMFITPYCAVFWCWDCILYQNSIFWYNPWDVWMVLL